MILEFMASRPGQHLTVLCGHTHGRGESQPLTNVQVFSGGADYGQPTIQRILDLN